MANPASLLPASRSAIVTKTAVDVAADRDTEVTHLIYVYLGSGTF